jgi:hypothetical protein
VRGLVLHGGGACSSVPLQYTLCAQQHEPCLPSQAAGSSLRAVHAAPGAQGLELASSSSKQHQQQEQWCEQQATHVVGNMKRAPGPCWQQAQTGQLSLSYCSLRCPQLICAMLNPTPPPPTIQIIPG